MIKHELKENLLHISIDQKDFSYRIPLDKIEKTIAWKIGSKESKGIVFNNVSTWALQLFTKKITEEKYVKQFMTIVQELAPQNEIQWDETLLAIHIQNKYYWMMDTNIKSNDKISEEEIIETLKQKHKLI